MHYYVYRDHKRESGTCRLSVEDARMDILEDLANGMSLALERKDYYSMGQIGGAMHDARTLDPFEEYEDQYANIATVECGDREWRIEKCYSSTCKAQDRAGDDW